ncbi:MAG: mechanosensitive ion channel family protein [Puniceicoccales bacterium]|jgi:small conductance mechanosensitive channel|nr:mechanosensitive ion channel family protein [Puniceicoccales bacterium]
MNALAALAANSFFGDFFELDFLNTLANSGVLLVWHAIAAVVILAAGNWLSKILQKAALRAMSRTGLEDTVRLFLSRLFRSFILVVVLLAVLNIFGVEATALVAAIGAVAMSIGLALQGSLSNFAAGVMLVVLRPFNVGDFIEAGGVSGTVEEIGLFSTALRTADNRLVTVPNSSFITQAITNYTAKPVRRIDLTVGVGYGDNLKTAQEIVRSVLAEEPRVLGEPVPSVFVTELGDSAVVIAVRPWVKTPDYWPVRAVLLEKLKLALEEGGCSIPFPQRDVHLFHENQSAK